MGRRGSKTDIMQFRAGDYGSCVVFAPYQGKYRSKRTRTVKCGPRGVTFLTPAEYDAAIKLENQHHG